MAKSYVIEQPLGRFLSGIGKIFLNNLNQKLNQLDIERNYYALILIEQADGNITQQELAILLDSDKVSVVRIIDYLSNNGYVKRIQNKTDRRKYCLTLTNKAIKALPKIKNTLSEISDKALKGLKKQQIEDLYKTLNKIKKNLSE